MFQKPFPWLLAAVTFGAAALRLDGLGQPSLWLDEILHVDIATRVLGAPWRAWMFGFGFEVENGPLFYAGQYLGRALAGGETGVRLAPAIAGILAVPALGLAGRALGGTTTGLVAATLIAVSPFHVYYSREGRPYALVMLFAALLLWLFLRRRDGAAGAVAVCVLAAYTGAIAGTLLAAAVTAGGLLLLSALWRGRGAASDAVARAQSIRRGAVLLAAPALGLALVGAVYLGAPRADPAPGSAAPPQAGVRKALPPNVTRAFSHTAATRTVTALALSGRDESRLEPAAVAWLVLAVFGVIATARREPRAGMVLASFLGVGLAASFLALHTMERWFLVRYLAPVLPAYLLAAAAAVAELGRVAGAKVERRGAATATVLALVLALGLPALATARQEPYLRADWRGAAAALAALARPGETVIACSAWSEICLRHYLGPRAAAFEIRDARHSIDAAQGLASGLDAAWLVTGGYHSRPELPRWMRAFHPIFRDPLESLAVTFYPDLRTLVGRRAGEPCDLCADRFAALGRKLEFDGRGAFFQGAGWHPPERLEDGGSFQWIDGREAELALPAWTPGAGLRLHVTPLVYPGAPAQGLVLRLDGRQLAQLALAPGWRTYTVALPGEAAGGGWHLLTFSLDHAARPRDAIPGSDDGRALGLAVASLEVTS